MKTKFIIKLTLLIVFSWFIACASGQTTQPTEDATKEKTAQERSFNLDELNKKLDFVYAPRGKGWNYKDVSLDNQDFQRWYRQNVQKFQEVINNLGPGFVIEVVGHTDESGPREAEPATGKKGNIWYSTERAKRVYDALINAGISRDKLRFVGVAEDQLIPGLDPYDQRHRRVTFRIGRQ